MPLLYQGSVVKEGEVYYRFNVTGEVKELPLRAAVSLVKGTPAKERNCLVRGDSVIAFKPNAGRNNKSRIAQRVVQVRLFFDEDDIKLPKDAPVIWSNDIAFRRTVRDKDFIKARASLIKRLDNATLMDLECGVIRMPYGVTSIMNLSTGCKTVLNALWVLKGIGKGEAYIFMGECGANFYPELFDAVANTGIVLFSNSYTPYLGTDFVFDTGTLRTRDYFEVRQVFEK